MKQIFFPFLMLVASLLLVTIFGFMNVEKTKGIEIVSADFIQSDITLCGSSENGSLSELEPSASIGLVPGCDSFHTTIFLRSDSAKIYFDQGLLMYYSFHTEEAAASFTKAITFDSTCAMLYWGRALCYDKNGLYKSMRNPASAVRAINKAMSLLESTPSFEADIIKATSKLISETNTSNEDQPNEFFETAMKNVFMKYPDNPEAAMFYLFARNWNTAPELEQEKTHQLKMLEFYDSLLRRFPQHPGLHHHFIHFIEEGEQFQKGLGSAEFLLKNYGGISHLVHMASHIYIQTGNYRGGVQVNDEAIRLFENYMTIYPPLTSGPSRYVHINHARNMAYANAMMLGSYKEAQRISIVETNSINQRIIQRKRKFRNDLQYYYMQPTVAFIRYGKWDSVLSEPTIPDSLRYARYIQTFCKGVALARLKKVEEANQQLSSLRAVSLSDASTIDFGANKLADYLRIMRPFLAAIISEEEKKVDAAEKYYREAILLEDSLRHDDPVQWHLPVRQYLGNMYLKEKLFKNAETQFREDLRIHPSNAWSLKGLWLALKGQKKIKESRVVELQLKNMKDTFDTDPVGAVF